MNEILCSHRPTVLVEDARDRDDARARDDNRRR